ncbi:MAG: hypothetical protein A2289_23300 [Deltaproteobacteria bacterium RIFOXYA12_FULL_58_15]|nr:MAG: hypothetical protein A2289_23300 [Deltaproteobacteria bacterium RIFOXYA12_FULL_58_15]OGR14293.1 MAG: hypothetical protein A2341_18780 [Deltaproteobacteria bacterium RIFOXYB12_FULL_58_9]
MLEALFRSRLRARALGWIFTHPDQRFFVRQLAEIIHEDSTNLSRELVSLAGLGIVVGQVEGRQRYYQANRACPIFAELRGLVVKTSGVADVLRAALAALGNKIRVAFVYGSVATGQETAESDVDLMVIGDLTFGEVTSALDGAQKQLGRDVNASVYPEAEARTKLHAGHHFLSTVWRGKKVFVIGDERELDRLG